MKIPAISRILGLAAIACFAASCAKEESSTTAAPAAAAEKPAPVAKAPAEKPAPAKKAEAKAEWIAMFNGKDLTGWKSNEENPNCFSVENGELKVSGGRAHLFYVGEDGKADFKDFEFKGKVKTTAGSNGGIYFHTAFEESGWPSKGYECQVNSTHKDPKKTGSIYGVVNCLVLAEGQEPPAGSLENHILEKAPSTDGEWFDYSITVKGSKITLKVNGEETATFTEPEGWDPATALKNMPGRAISHGIFAIQGHDPDSTCYYKDFMVRKL